MYRAFYSQNKLLRNLIFKLSSYSDEFSLAEAFISQYDVRAALDPMTNEVIAAFDNIMKQTEYTSSIEALNVSKF